MRLFKNITLSWSTSRWFFIEIKTFVITFCIEIFFSWTFADIVSLTKAIASKILKFLLRVDRRVEELALSFFVVVSSDRFVFFDEVVVIMSSDRKLCLRDVIVMIERCADDQDRWVERKKNAMRKEVERVMIVDCVEKEEIQVRWELKVRWESNLSRTESWMKSEWNSNN